MKRKALLGTNSFNQEPPELNPPGANLQTGSLGAENVGNRPGTFTAIGGGIGNLSSVVGNMEANKVVAVVLYHRTPNVDRAAPQMQRTPLVSRVNNNTNMGVHSAQTWAPRHNLTHNRNTHSHSHGHGGSNRQQFPAPNSMNPPRTNSISDGSDSGMGSHSRPSKLPTLASHNSWPNSGANIQTRGGCRPAVKGSNVTCSPQAKPSGRFRPPAQYNAGR